MVFVIITACEICKLANSNDYSGCVAKEFLARAVVKMSDTENHSQEIGKRAADYAFGFSKLNIQFTAN